VGQGAVDIARRFEGDPDVPGQAAKESAQAVISSRLLPIRNAGAPSRSPRPALRRRLPSQFHFATSHVCDLRVVSAAIVLRPSVPDVWTQGCRHAGGRHAHSAGTLGL